MKRNKLRFTLKFNSQGYDIYYRSRCVGGYSYTSSTGKVNMKEIRTKGKQVLSELINGVGEHQLWLETLDRIDKEYREQFLPEIEDEYK